MKERMQKIPMSIDSHPQKDSTECESYEGVQAFMDMTENDLKEVQFELGNLLEFILSPENLNRAYLQVKRNLQQAVSQILSPIYERQFSNTSFGFRPHRSCHKACRIGASP